MDKKKLRRSNHCLQLRKGIIKDNSITQEKATKHKLQQGKVQSDIDKIFFTMMVMQHWNKCPVLLSPSLEILKI